MLNYKAVRGDYFKPGKSHICRFCHKPIQKLFKRDDGKEQLMPLGNYCMWKLALDNGVMMSVNSCKDCRDVFDDTDQALLDATMESNLVAWAINGESVDKLKVKIFGNAKIVARSKEIPKNEKEESFDAVSVDLGV